ncbi:MAG: hypothetical protein H0W18_04105 [Acidobacteria bacterium]|nr:hypothetical protein [Acidobacteriota bacterium]
MLEAPETAPFPSNVFTVRDATHNTGLRLNLPKPDCTISPSDCDDLDVVNALDGFGLQPQLAIPFDGPIDAATVDSAAVFLVALGSPGTEDPPGPAIGINQVVWDSLSNTLYAEADELLAQHARYALIVTNRLRDLQGREVAASESFLRFRRTVRGEYKQALLEALDAARAQGIHAHDIVSASVFTTQSVTSVMERIRDQIKSGLPEAASFALGPLGERAVFSRDDVAGISWRQQTRVNPAVFATSAINLALLDVVPGAVGTIAYGRYVSPEYLVHPGEYIPVVGTLTGDPVVQGQNNIYFTLFLPSGSRPAAGWPVVIAGHSATGNQHQTTGVVASIMASYGIATIGINNPGNGFGPLSSLTINLSNGTSLSIADEGRGVDQDGDGAIGIFEGSVAATIQERDTYRQAVADLMQLVRVIDVGMDVDGDGSGDLDAGSIFYHGVSAGATVGAMLTVLEPRIAATVMTVTPGFSPEYGRWSPARRAIIGSRLASRTPSLVNSPGITSIDGVPTAAPFYNENKPSRDQSPVVNTSAGAIEIQRAMELSETAQAGSAPVVWAPYLRLHPLSGMTARPVIVQSAEGDQNAVSPGTAAILRAGGLADWTLHYRHDLVFDEDPTIPKNPHTVLLGITHPSEPFRSAARGMLNQIGAFFASGGTDVILPEPVRFFEVPIRRPLPEALNFIR